MRPWRILVSPPAGGAQNMAVDHALLDRASRGEETVLRLYGWARPTLSLGLHERARLRAETAAAAGVDVVRRPTGGRALLHHREVTYSVTAPLTHASLRESYAAINTLLLDALHRLGVAAQAAQRAGRPLGPDGAACFAEPNAGELVVDGRKLVGSAQRRDDRAFLQHGSILLHDDQGMVARLRGTPAPPPAATLNDALGRDVTVEEVHEALRTALDAAGLHATPLDPAGLADDVARHLDTYADPRWTFRR